MVKFRHLCVWGGGCYNNNYVNLLHSSVLPKTHSAFRCKLVGEAASVHYSPFFAQLQAGELHLVHTLVQSILVISKYGAEHSGDSLWCRSNWKACARLRKSGREEGGRGN